MQLIHMVNITSNGPIYFIVIQCIISLLYYGSYDSIEYNVLHSNDTSTILDINSFNVNTYTYFMIRVIFYTMYPLFLTLELKVDNRKNGNQSFLQFPL